MSAAGSYPHPNVPDDRRAPQPLDTPATAPSMRPGSGAAPGDDNDARRPTTAAARIAARLSAAARATEEVADPPRDESTAAPIATDGVDLSAFSIAGISRRHVGWVAAALLSIWIVVVFARQAAEASSAANRADEIALENASLVAEIASLEDEFRLIERPTYVAQQARGYRLGTTREIPFTLDPSVASPGPNAPGSASVRLGAAEARVTPLESWLSLLFGPTD